ncbi:hypothetical protein B5E58_05140 [Tyzzerella sp. An114]|uniref:hypothetical protein n=1 Tax=Tyzzerella sp. An114 TaxID=1965545 RepID=UPI000B43A462|nr:hypothetical protein [Tyzzerella sp. An114]OUQ59162.1 hypothetical protein B5E58_05140 [Tyzzerella sp. An114]
MDNNESSNIRGILENFGFNTENINNNDIIEALSKAKKIKSLIEMNSNVKKQEEVHNEINTDDKNNFIYAAIPFLNEEYQKSIYIAVKLIELKKAFDMPVISIQSKTVQKSSYERKKELLSVIKKYMSKEEAAKIDSILKFIEMRKLINMKGEIFFE